MNTQNTLVLLPGMDGTGELFAPLLHELKQLDTTLKVIVMAYPRDIPLDYAASATGQTLPRLDFMRFICPLKRAHATPDPRIVTLDPVWLDVALADA